MSENQQMQLGLQTQRINLKEFAAKFATKGEIYRFLAVEAKVYLPDYRTVTIWHMKELTSGLKIVSAHT